MTTDIGVALARVQAQIPSVRLTTGLFLGVQDGQARVRFGDGEAVIPVAAEAWPMVGDTVTALQVGADWVLLGPTVPRPVFGVVQSVTSTHATVLVDGKTASLLRPAGVTVTAGQTAHISWANGGVIVAVYGGAPSVQDIPSEVGGGGVQRTAVFNAVDSGTGFANGYWQSDSSVFTKAANGADAFGCWFYRDIQASVPPGASIVSARIYLPVDGSSVGSTHAIGWHASTGKQGVPSVSNDGVIVPRSGANWYPLNPSLAAAVAGGNRGICVRGGAGSKYRGVHADRLSGALELTWKV